MSFAAAVTWAIHTVGPQFGPLGRSFRGVTVAAPTNDVPDPLMIFILTVTGFELRTLGSGTVSPPDMNGSEAQSCSMHTVTRVAASAPANFAVNRAATPLGADLVTQGPRLEAQPTVVAMASVATMTATPDLIILPDLPFPCAGSCTAADSAGSCLRWVAALRRSR